MKYIENGVNGWESGGSGGDVLNRARQQVVGLIEAMPPGFLKGPTPSQQVQRTPGFGFVTASQVDKTFKPREVERVKGRPVLHAEQIVMVGARVAFGDEWTPRLQKQVGGVIKEEMLKVKKKK